MEIRVKETKKYLKVEKIAKKELIVRIIIFFLIILYFFIHSYRKYGKITIGFALFTSPVVASFYLAFIIKYPYEVLIIKNGKIIRYVSLFYRYLRWCKAFNFLEIYNINELKTIYFKNTTEILVSKAIKRTESPYHKIHLTFKDKSYKGFGMKLKDKDAKDIVLTINKFLEKYKKEAKIKRFTLIEKENLMEKYNSLLDERYNYILNKIIDEEKLFISEKDNDFIINGDSEAIKNLEIFKNMN
ncbi:hypothetical protein, partial [Fusobacterium sp. 1001295B_180824_G3]